MDNFMNGNEEKKLSEVDKQKLCVVLGASLLAGLIVGRHSRRAAAKAFNAGLQQGRVEGAKEVISLICATVK